MNKLLSIIGIIGLLTGISGCKKGGEIPTEIPVSPTTGTRTQFTLDSIFLYAKQIYLWNDAIPSYAAFNPRKYDSNPVAVNAFETELFDISQLKINTQTGLRYEASLNPGSPKYSFLTERSNSGDLAAVGAPVLAAVLKDTIIVNNNKPVAYIALGSFPELSTCQAALDGAFTKLAAANPQQLVVDLRSNGGGFVETAEYVADLIALSSLNGKVMFSEQYNSLLQASQATILKNQLYLDANGKTITYKGRNATLADVDYTVAGNTHQFSKKGNLESVKDIYFITSSNTASASELLISSMKPYFNIKLVGDTTYGKPVGFFPVNIDVYSVYLSGFLIRNSQGWSDYFQGIPADVLVTADSDPVLGNPAEPCFNAVLNMINGSPVNTTAKIVKRQATQTEPAFKSNSPNTASVSKIMIENRLKLKNQ
ncbi:S41 family peptidase [Mucilaginibacter lappiensis]|jgi:hypothetical protein|uniref:S41 family peptidase n=1 Tax=Mucilaginibacter lappiensis TaxID=354630 RepID=UPI003D1DADB7